MQCQSHLPSNSPHRAAGCGIFSLSTERVAIPSPTERKYVPLKRCDKNTKPTHLFRSLLSYLLPTRHDTCINDSEVPQISTSDSAVGPVHLPSLGSQPEATNANVLMTNVAHETSRAAILVAACKSPWSLHQHIRKTRAPITRAATITRKSRLKYQSSSNSMPQPRPY